MIDMVKTTPLNPDTHKLLKSIQKALRDRYHITMSIQDIVSHIIPNCEESIKKVITDIRNIKIEDANNPGNVDDKLKIEKLKIVEEQ